MVVATLLRRWSKKVFTNNVVTAIKITVSLIRLSILQPNKSYSKRRCHCSIVLLFFSVLFCYFFTHISERSIVNTLNDARSNPLLDETMSSPPVLHMAIHHYSVSKSSVGENLSIRMTKTRFYEPAKLSTPAKPLFSLKPLDANLVEVIVILGLPQLVPAISVHKTLQANDVIKFRTAPRGKLKTENGRYQ